MYINLPHLPRLNFAYPFFPFLSTYMLVCFHCFILHLAPWFSFVFQFVFNLVLFLTGKYNFLFPCSPGQSMYFIFGLFWLCSRVYIYVCVCVFHYFNYYLPDFVAAICLGFIFGLSLRIFALISLNAIINHLWNLHSWPEIKTWAFGMGALSLRR